MRNISTETLNKFSLTNKGDYSTDRLHVYELTEEQYTIYLERIIFQSAVNHLNLCSPGDFKEIPTRLFEVLAKLAEYSDQAELPIDSNEVYAIKQMFRFINEVLDQGNSGERVFKQTILDLCTNRAEIDTEKFTTSQELKITQLQKALELSKKITEQVESNYQLLKEVCDKRKLLNSQLDEKIKLLEKENTKLKKQVKRTSKTPVKSKTKLRMGAR